MENSYHNQLKGISEKEGKISTFLDEMIDVLAQAVNQDKSVCKLLTSDAIKIAKALHLMKEKQFFLKAAPPHVLMKYTCPNCGITLDPSVLVDTDSEKAIEAASEEQEELMYSYCPRCGQRIEWERDSLC